MIEQNKPPKWLPEFELLIVDKFFAEITVNGIIPNFFFYTACSLIMLIPLSAVLKSTYATSLSIYLQRVYFKNGGGYIFIDDRYIGPTV